MFHSAPPRHGEVRRAGALLRGLQPRFESLTRGYGELVKKAIRMSGIVLLALGGVVLGMGGVLKVLPTGLCPARTWATTSWP